MYRFKFSFLAISLQMEFRIEASSMEDLDSFLRDLFAVYARFDTMKQQWAVDFIQNTPDLYKKTEQLVAKYSKTIPSVNGLTAYLRRLTPNEFFYFLPDIELPAEALARLNAFLLGKHEGKSFEEVYDVVKEYWEIRDTYNVNSYGKSRIFIGEPLKSFRKCRFCGKGEAQGATFGSRAHAISEALGNKNIILFDECDGCNTKFSKTIEADIITFLSLFRTIFKVKGKAGLKDFKGKKFHVTNENGIIIKFEGKPESKPFSMPYGIKLATDQPIIQQNIYKTLCKYFLSVIDSSELIHFEKTIAWINGDIELEKLPKVAELLSYRVYTQHPKLFTYIQKKDDGTLPYAVGEFHFTIFVYVFIIPLCAKDSSSFTDDELYRKFWDSFKQYDKMGNWKYLDLSSTKAGKFELTLKFEVEEKVAQP